MSSIDSDSPKHPPYDPEVLPALKKVRSLFPRFTEENLPAIRALLADGFPGMPPFDLTLGGEVATNRVTVPASDGRPDLELLVLSPANGVGPWPAVYHMHGGGMIAGNARGGVDELVDLVADVGVVVVSPEYRLAPENPDPAPVDDCYAGLVWTARHATELGIDPDRMMIFGGSAGGGLAAGTALLARDRGFPTLTHQVLSSPMLDDRFTTKSSQELDGEGMWDRNENRFGWTALLGERRGGPDVSIYSAPARATDLSGLPKTYVDCGSVETFRDEVIDYAQRLLQAGVSVDLHIWGGGFHGFDFAALDARIAILSVATRREFLVRALTS